MGAADAQAGDAEEATEAQVVYRKDVGAVALVVFPEGHFPLDGSLGIHVSALEPAIDLFLLWWMVSLTTIKHADWVEEQIRQQEILYAESQKSQYE